MSVVSNLSFLVEPVEPVVFSPPKSASAGEAHTIESQFPPSPRTMQGLVRTRLLLGADPPPDLADRASASIIASLVGPPESLPEGWQLRGPFPATSQISEENSPVVCPWVPTPRFLLREGKRGRRAPVFARHIRYATHPALSDLGDADETPCLGRPDLGVMAPSEGWIGPTNLRLALSGEGETQSRAWRPDQWSSDRPPFVHTESQSGLAIDPETGTARHNALFFAHALRFSPGSGLFGSLSGSLASDLRPAALTEGAVQAGRKGRLVCFRPVPALHEDWIAVQEGRHLPDGPDEDECFWLVALTPAFLSDPRYPLGRASDSGRRNVTITIEAALTGPLQTLGGFDMVSGRPRPNRLYVPAGSAWLFRLSGGTPKDRGAVLRSLHDRHCLGDPIEAAMGFGHTLVGRGPLNTEQKQ